VTRSAGAGERLQRNQVERMTRRRRLTGLHRGVGGDERTHGRPAGSTARPGASARDDVGRGARASIDGAANFTVSDPETEANVHNDEDLRLLGPPESPTDVEDSFQHQGVKRLERSVRTLTSGSYIARPPSTSMQRPLK
jgi:hypothetical protein